MRVARIIAESDKTHGKGDRKEENGNYVEDTNGKCDVLEVLNLRVKKIPILPVVGVDCYQRQRYADTKQNRGEDVHDSEEKAASFEWLRR
ncbi:unnamed protein product [Dibothriocephalus latus]|uniref:Uncharacterized protein n=1 Tax=Dibothriocephalus latus TaxID=60516 RepID=A0A3P6U6Q9_DIBLA|nr:unnamed protein product [Dibothriocephalus latus]